MFQLYKKRNFNAIFNDTFAFFKAQGKNYFRNYFIINGGLLLVLAVLIYFIGDVFFKGLFTGMTNPESRDLLDSYFGNNTGYFISAGILIFLLVIFISLINYSFPLIYLKLLETNKQPDSGEIYRVMKAKLGRVIIFSLLSLITFIPIAMILGGVCILLIMIIIGIPLIFIAIPAFMCWMFLSFYDYINNNTGFFTAMGNGFNMLFKNFWGHMGATLLFYIMLYILQSILSFIPYFVGFAFMIFDADGAALEQDQLSTVGILLLITFIFSILLSYIFGNITVINQGMIFYSCMEEQSNHSLHSEIDQIGTTID